MRRAAGGVSVAHLWGARKASCTGISIRSTIGEWSRSMCAKCAAVGHYLAEEVPQETLRELATFFAAEATPH